MTRALRNRQCSPLEVWLLDLIFLKLIQSKNMSQEALNLKSIGQYSELVIINEMCFSES